MHFYALVCLQHNLFYEYLVSRNTSSEARVPNMKYMYPYGKPTFACVKGYIYFTATINSPLDIKTESTFLVLKSTYLVLKSKSSIKISVDFCYFAQPFCCKIFLGVHAHLSNH